MDIFKGAKKRAMLEINDEYVFNDIYFGSEGLTSASAEHVAAMASVMAEAINEKVAGLRLYEKRIRVIGDTDTVVETINDTIPEISDAVARICKTNSLIAWLREAIKERADAISNVSNLDLNRWLKLQGIELPKAPERPERPTINFKDLKTVLKTGLTLKEYNRFVELDSMLAVYGNMIHDKGLLTRQRKQLQKLYQHPNEVEGNGRDTIITSYSFRENALDYIDSAYTKLQSEYRKLQAEKNGIEAKFSNLAMAYQSEAMDEYNKKMAQYDSELSRVGAEIEKLNNQMKEWKRDEMARLAALKIVIPNDLKGIYNELKEKYL